MHPDEKNVIFGTLGLLVGGVGAFLPWARIGGRNRSGFNTADTFISLADGALPDAVAWVGRWWYAPTVLALGAWSTTFIHASRAVRVAAALLLAVGIAMWWLFYWAGQHYGLLDMQLAGPVIATLGFVVIGAATTRAHGSILRPRATESP